MQGVWWYLMGDSPQGPVSRELLDAMLHEGTLTHESLIWQEGLSHWICVSQLPVSLPHAPASAFPSPPGDLALAGAWRRFLARMLDLWALLLLALALALFALPRLWPGFMDWIAQPLALGVCALMLFPLLLLIEAAIFARFGNTPGKALCGVALVTLEGQRLTGMQYLRRQLGVFWYGFATGLPGIYLIAMASQGLHLGNGDPAAYDAGKYAVLAHPLDWKRRLWLASTAGVLIGSSMLLLQLPR